jgi:hypothetical protein
MPERAVNSGCHDTGKISANATIRGAWAISWSYIELNFAKQGRVDLGRSGRATSAR